MCAAETTLLFYTRMQHLKLALWESLNAAAQVYATSVFAVLVSADHSSALSAVRYRQVRLLSILQPVECAE